MRRFYFLILLGLFSCDKDEMDPLKVKLIGTTWTVDKMQLIDLNNLVTRTELHDPDDLKNDQKVSFRNDQYMSLYTEGGISGCGQWNIDNGKIHFIISYGQLIQSICSQANFAVIFSANNNIEIVNDTLIIEGLGGAFDQFHYLSDWTEIREQVEQGQIQAKIYFKKVDIGTQPELNCCGKFDWI